MTGYIDKVYSLGMDNQLVHPTDLQLVQQSNRLTAIIGRCPQRLLESAQWRFENDAEVVEIFERAISELYFAACNEK